MPKLYYFPRLDGGRFQFLQNLAANAPNYAVLLKILGSELSLINGARDLAEVILDLHNRAMNFAKDWTALKTAMWDAPVGSPAPAWPVWTGPATAPISLMNGLVIQIRAIIARWKKEPGYTPAIGQILGIEGAEQEIDLVNAKPLIKLRISGGQPEVVWKKEGMEALELEVDRGDGFKLLTIDTVPNYFDTQPMPGPGQSAVWKYRAIYHMNNHRVGQWSDVVQIPVALAA